MQITGEGANCINYCLFNSITQHTFSVDVHYFPRSCLCTEPLMLARLELRTILFVKFFRLIPFET